MEDAARLAATQLARMRGMTRYYHQRFFADIRFSTIAVLVLLVLGWWEVPEAFLLVPVAALLGAASTAFDASYLIFARQYAARLEGLLNEAAGREVLVASELETAYLFPLDERKIVVAGLGRSFTWFGFMTLFFTALGAASFGFGLALGWSSLRGHGDAWTIAYLAVLGGLTLAALLVGIWWFPGGEGERRLREVLDRSFG
jgi:hypothetical protein